MEVIFSLSMTHPDGTETGVAVTTHGGANPLVFLVLVVVGLGAVA